MFEPSSPLQKFARTGDRATGPGVIDDKGGVAVIMMPETQGIPETQAA